MRVVDNFICPEENSRKRARILVVEDQTDIREALVELLQIRWDVEAVEDGKAALEVAERSLPDLVLSDVIMPHLDGFGLLKALRSNPKTNNIPFILLSARAGEEKSRIEALEEGADDYVFKPFSDKELEARISTQLKLWEARKSHLSECQKLTSIMDTVPALLSRIDKNERFIFINKECERSLRPHQNIVGQTLKDLFGETEYKNLEPHLRSVLSGESVTFEWFNYLGPRHDYIVTCTPEFGDDGKVETFISCVINIDEKKKTEAIAKEDRTRFNDFLMQAPIPMVILIGPEHRFALANEPYQKFIGRNAVGKTLLEVFSLEEAENFVPLLDEVYRTGIAHIGKEIPFYITVDSGEIKEKFLTVAYYPFKEHSNEVKGVLAVVQDMTEQVVARKVIEENEHRIQEITNTLPQMVWSANSEGVLTWYNQVWYDYTGLNPGEDWDGINTPIHPEDIKSVWEEQKKAVDRGEVFQIEFRVKRHFDGMYRWHLARGVPILNKENAVMKWIGSSTDIHDHKILVDKLTEERELREKFVLTLSHDLRTPLTAVKMKADLLSRKQVSREQVKDLAERIIFNMDRADFMIRDLLDVNLIKAGGGIPILINFCHLNKMLDSVIKDLTDHYGPRFKMNNDFGDFNVYWDCSAIQRVIENLVGNAIKYGSEKTPIVIQLKKNKDWAEISVHNEGLCISSEELKFLFNPFARTETAIKSGKIGWGIGLTLVKGITEAHGGFATAESSLDRGTIFSIHLPLDARKALQRA